jgi:DNA-binding response OmpR family regulator
MGLAIDSAGFEVAWSSFSPSEIADFLRDFKPNILFVHAELSSSQVSTLLARLDGAGASKIPLVMLCKDVSDGVFVTQLKSGVVEMMAEPFNARLYTQRLKLLSAEIELRKGEIKGSGKANELGSVVHHIMRTRRSGALMVGTSTDRAFFVRGVLKHAECGALQQQAALAALTRLNKPWVFIEGADANTVHADVTSVESDDMRIAATPPPTRQSATSLPAVLGVPHPTHVKTHEAPSQSATNLKSVATAVSWSATLASPSASVDAEAGNTPLLFVDDDPSVVQMLHNYFSKKGYPCAIAGDGVEALARLAQTQFEMVIADLNMPRLDGWGLLKMVREDFRTHEVPVALFSAHDSYREGLRLTQSGAQAYFPKTLKLTSLEMQLKELLEPRRRFTRLISSEGGIHFNFSQLGVQWVLRALAKMQFSGQLDARDPWAAWRLWFVAGRLTQASARIQSVELSGDRALCAFLASKQCEGSLSRENEPVEEGFARHPTESTLQRLVPWMNDEQSRTRESELMKAKALSINPEIYGLYLTITPPQWTDMVRLLCESRATPAEVISQLHVSPQEVATVVKDLIRRGVASLQS